MVHRVCWMEMTDSSIYGASCLIELTVAVMVYGVLDGNG
jgi:hypothetical protein